MAVEYRLTIAGDVALTEIATRALPDAAERIKQSDDLLTVPMPELGLHVIINAGRGGYLSG